MWALLRRLNSNLPLLHRRQKLNRSLSKKQRLHHDDRSSRKLRQPRRHRSQVPPARSRSLWRKPSPLTPRPPEYPDELLLKGIRGSGVCVVSVDLRTGRVNEASMAQSTGNPILDKSAVSTFRKWRLVQAQNSQAE
ncbi:MAG: hypothetical protein DMF37_03530 [Verrucomicrobia bacterium]|nr:MAG: hypothetical protein DMF37_03530 [Verrucomicrobiota bacterium]